MKTTKADFITTQIMILIITLLPFFFIKNIYNHISDNLDQLNLINYIKMYVIVTFFTWSIKYLIHKNIL